MKASIRRLVLSACLLLSPCAAQANDPGQPVFEVVDAAALKGVRRVAVTSFTVQYVMQQVWDTSHFSAGSLQTAGQGGGFDIQSVLEPAKMQDVTDRLYQDFLAELRSAGLDVVTTEQLSQSNAFRAFAGQGPAVPRKEEASAEKSTGAGAITSVFYTPAGIPLVLGDKIDHLSAGTFGSNVADPTLTFTGRLSLYTTNWPHYDAEVQKELDAATLHVRLYVPLAHVQVASGSFWGSGYSRQGIVPGLRLGNRLTRVTVGHDRSYAKIVLGEPYLIPGPIDSTVEEVKHPNPVRAMVGEKVRIYPGTVSKERYWEAMPEAAGQVLKAFAARIKAGAT